jgi:O-antigen ligase
MSAAIQVSNDGRRAYLSMEKLYAVLALMVVPGAFMPLLFGYRDIKPVDPVGVQIIKMGVFVAAAGLLFRIKVAAGVASPICLSLVLLIAFAVSSVYWSVDPWLTSKRLIPLLGTTLVGVYFGARFTLHGFLKSAFVALSIMTAASLVVGSLLPEYGIRGTGLWAGFRGVFTHKNTLGPIAALSMMTSIYWTALNIGLNRKWVWIGVGAASMSVLCLILTLSVSSYINALLAIAILLSLRIIQRAGRLRMSLMLCFACLTVLGVMVSLANLAAISEFFGRDATLTGRTDIWRFAIHLMEREPLFGYGYAVAWDKLGWYFDAVHVHNGFLQVALDLGIIGLGLCVAFLVQVGWRCFSLLVRSEGFVSTWPAALFSLILLGNVTEVNLLDGGKIQWCLLVFVASWASVEVRGRERKIGKMLLRGAGRAPIAAFRQGRTSSL